MTCRVVRSSAVFCQTFRPGALSALKLPFRPDGRFPCCRLHQLGALAFRSLVTPSPPYITPSPLLHLPPYFVLQTNVNVSSLLHRPTLTALPCSSCSTPSITPANVNVSPCSSCVHLTLGTARQDRPASKSFVSGSGFGEFYSALVGDAAHPARPSFGQGANMALEDAVQLGLVLREAGSVRGPSDTHMSSTVLYIDLRFRFLDL